MHSRLLEHFLAVVDHRNMTAAAKSLNITQPGLTKNIKALEKTLGAPLFKRQHKGVVLTPEGEALERRVRLMESEYRHAVSEIHAIRAGLSGTLRIAAEPVWLKTILPSALAEFYGQYPKVKITLTSGDPDSVRAGLLNGEIDLACCSLDFQPHAKIVTEKLIDLTYAIVASADHPLAQIENVSAEDLASHPWLTLFGDSAGHHRINTFFSANLADPPKSAIETDPLAMMEILQTGVFLAHMPERLLESAAKFGLVRIPFKGPFYQASAGIAYRRTRHAKKMIESFNAVLREAAR